MGQQALVSLALTDYSASSNKYIVSLGRLSTALSLCLIPPLSHAPRLVQSLDLSGRSSPSTVGAVTRVPDPAQPFSYLQCTPCHQYPTSDQIRLRRRISPVYLVALPWCPLTIRERSMIPRFQTRSTSIQVTRASFNLAEGTHY